MSYNIRPGSKSLELMFWLSESMSHMPDNPCRSVYDKDLQSRPDPEVVRLLNIEVPRVEYESACVQTGATASG